MSDFEPQWFGEYELVKPLGKGGMAEVFIARTSRAEGFEKVVVVKRMLSQLAQDQRFVEMFLSEARLAVQLRHTNVVEILALELHEGQPFIVMEYVHGKDMRQVLYKAKKESDPVPLDFGIYCLTEMLNGLGHAHQAIGSDGAPLNLIHRDVTPANIFLSYDGDVKLGDFGVALSGGELKAAELRGKLSYLAPEALDNQSLDARSDLFSAGIVMWETLALRSLFKGRNDGEILMQVKNRVPEAPSVHNPAVPKELDTIVAKALAKRPDDRFQTAQEFEEALTDWLFSTRARWTRRLVADEMRRRYPEESKPLVLPPPSMLPVMGSEIPLVPPAGPATEAANPWPESIESLGDDLDEDALPRPGSAVEFQHSDQLMAYRAGAAGPVSLSLNQLLPLLTEQPQSVMGLGVVGGWRLRREDLGRLLYWDTLSPLPPLPQQPATEGSFENFSLTRLVFELSMRRQTCLVLIEQGRGSGYRIVGLEDGCPVYIASSRPQDGAPVLIHQRQLLPNSLLYNGIVQVISDRVPLDQALQRAAGPANRQVVERTFSALVRHRLYEAFYWNEGRFRVYPDCGSPLRLATRVPSLLGVLMRGVRRALGAEDLQNALYMKGLRRVELAPDRLECLAALRLKPDEQAVVKAIDGRSSVAQLMSRLRCTTSEQEALVQAVLYVLHETRIAMFS
ncbi:MAG: serine/threonine protein kinase [Deltaproteobacteria bacterium]|nr:serine/threonine protein kinase [Deltaproteobacteria bacterium]